MQKEIKYNGFTATPSDYESPDGDLAAVINLVPEDGQLNPILPATQLFKLPIGYRPIFIHKSAAFTHPHYIIRYDDTTTTPATIKLYWINEPSTYTEYQSAYFIDSGEGKNLLHTFTSIHEVNAIGNTIVVLADDGMHYLLWKEGAYKYLGTHMPELSISFGLQGKVKHSDQFTLPDIGQKYDVTEEIQAQINKFIAENQTNSGRFILPFFVRYAYRLYDGTTLTMQSSPVLMVASAGVAPNIIITGTAGYEGTCEVVAVRSFLDYVVDSSTQLEELKEWGDIVSSVDVFISQPIYTYDQNEKCKRSHSSIKGLSHSFSFFHQNDQNITELPVSDYPLRYQRKTLIQSLIMECGSNTITHDNVTFNNYIPLPAKSEDKVKEEIRNCSTFYLLRSFKLNELATVRTTIEIEDDYLQSLTSREVLKDDYQSHDLLIPKFSFVYNSRLNIANINKSLYNGYPSKSLVQHTDGLVTYYTDSTSPTVKDGTSPLKVWVYINEGGKDIVVENDLVENAISPYSKPLYLYYPNPNAYKAVIFLILGIGDLGHYYELPLERHNYLNGAFYFNGWEEPSTEASESPDPSLDKLIPLPNKLYTSEVNNPFYFPVKNINTIGTGEIKGICAAVKAMSQGQYGQFPLYAFTDEGVWTLEVSKDGTFGSIPPPVTRDVCINQKSITQLDSTVLFATERGIMMLSGSSSICISEVLDSTNPFTIEQLPNSYALAGLNGFNVFDFNYIPFRQFIKECRMIYDYTNQRIIVFNPSTETVSGGTRRRYTYAYVYSLKSKQWGMMKNYLNDNINSYPDALAFTNYNTVVNLSDPDEDAVLQGVRGMLITRPLKLDEPDVLKTIDTIIQRGYFRKGSVSCVLLGSRDLFNWQIIYSSSDHYLRGFRGTPYKYFRLVIYCDMQKDESLFGCTVQYTPRLTDQPR